MSFLTISTRSRKSEWVRYENVPDRQAFLKQFGFVDTTKIEKIFSKNLTNIPLYGILSLSGRGADNDEGKERSRRRFW